MVELTRRDVIRLGATATGLAALTPILGCAAGGGRSTAESSSATDAASSSATASAASSASTQQVEGASDSSRGTAFTKHDTGGPTVYFTSDISPEGLVAVYEALDCACADLVYVASDGTDLVNRIESLNGWHTLEYGQQIGLGSMDYTLVSLS